MAPPVRSLRTELLVSFGFVTSAAVILAGLTTALLQGGDPRETLWPVVALWVGNTVVFLVFGAYVLRRLVLRPLQRLTAEADELAAGNVAGAQARYGSVELDRLADRYRAMAADLLDVQSHVVRVEKLAGIGRLAAGVAHEVRNPLGALGTYVEVLRRRGTDPAVTAEMQTAIERIDRTVEALLTYARPGGAIGHADANAAVRTGVDFLTAQGMLRERGIGVHLDPQAPAVRGGQHALEQVVLNLVINACQAAADGRVTIGTIAMPYEPRRAAARRDDPEASAATGRRRCSRPRRPDLAPGTPGVLLYVADEGPGIPEEYRERIFDPFFTTKDPGQGTGLGLAIVARTVQESGGVVWADRAREGGAVFKVFLPRAGEADAAADR